MKPRKIADKVAEIIDMTYYTEFGDLTVSEIAKRMGYSVTYISKVFKRYSRYTIGQYLKLQKYSWAYALLQSNKCQTVKEVAEMLDIRSTSHFTKVFKERESEYPGELKKNARKRWAGILKKKDRK